MLIPDGFPGQRLRILPNPLVTSALRSPITSKLIVTDAGHFPHAAAHGRSRADGAQQAIFMLCTGGGGWLQTGSRITAVAAGDAVVIPRNTPHRYWADDRDPWTLWWLHVDGSDVDELVAAILGAEHDPLVTVRDMYGAVDLIDSIVTTFERDDTIASLYSTSGVAWNLLAQIASDRLRGKPASTDRIRSVQDYLRQNLASQIPVSDLARQADMSTSHFSALFKASAGIGVVEYVKRLRSARARELLITTQASVADIARSVGYADAFYFSRQFHAINGMSPREFRAKSHRDQI